MMERGRRSSLLAASSPEKKVYKKEGQGADATSLPPVPVPALDPLIEDEEGEIAGGRERERGRALRHDRRPGRMERNVERAEVRKSAQMMKVEWSGGADTSRIHK